MIILPPEEKKSSPITKWVFRILMIFVVVSAFALFALNILSGTSDAHRRGLEQAFSDMFKMPVSIGSLKTFNIFPKFHIEMNDVRAAYGSSGGEIRAENVIMVFRFFDILFSRDLIENLQITNLTMTPDVIGSHGLRIETAGIIPANAEGRASAFEIKGEYGGLPVHGTLELQNVGGMQPVYRIRNEMPAEISFGSLQLKGKFAQTDKGEPSIHTASFLLDGKNIATGGATLKTADPDMGFEINFETPLTHGQLVSHGSQKSQTWSFEKLDLADVVSENPLWAQVENAIKKIKPAVSKAEATEETQTISISIKSLTGKVSAENLQGHFLSKPDALIGWWDGVITAAPETKKRTPEAGTIQCGLLSLKPKGGVWSSDVSIVKINPLTLKTQLSVNETTGKIDFSVDRIAAGPVASLNEDLKSFKAIAQQTDLSASHPCSALIGPVVTP